MRDAPDQEWRIARRDAEGVRRVRKTCKLARARLRLAEEAGLPGARTLRRSIRDVARELAPVRDAQIAGDLAQEILAEPRRQGRLRRFPAEERSAAWWAARQKELAELERDIAAAGFRPLSHRELRRALRHSFQRLRRAARAANRKRTLAAAHAWRKRAVVLRCQLSLAAPLLGRRAEDLSAALKRLTRRLGRATDCRALAQAMEGPARELVPKTLKRELNSGMETIKRRSLRRSRRLWRDLKPRLKRQLG
ncbi:MAG TPA: CHAD domain-containing protein [Opitutaceae bacterium]|jgi:hypothetical protein|nr:CHAD domain-containing protein [Opitutaceae bacterium]